MLYFHQIVLKNPLADLFPALITGTITLRHNQHPPSTRAKTEDVSVSPVRSFRWKTLVCGLGFQCLKSVGQLGASFLWGEKSFCANPASFPWLPVTPMRSSGFPESNYIEYKGTSKGCFHFHSFQTTFNVSYRKKYTVHGHLVCICLHWNLHTHSPLKLKFHQVTLTLSTRDVLNIFHSTLIYFFLPFLFNASCYTLNWFHDLLVCHYLQLKTPAFPILQ